MRIDSGGARGAAITISVDGTTVPCFEGETIATALLAQDIIALRRDGQGRPRGLFCNMGACCECMVTLKGENRRVRACISDVRDGMDIGTDG